MESLFKVFMPKSISEGVEKILYSGKLSSGKNVREFEQSVTRFLGVENFVAVNSYSSAAEIVWKIIGIGDGDEIIASPMSCLASNQPVVNRNAKIKWTDIDPYVGSLDPDAVRKNITKHTKAILHYHWGGYPGYIDEILSVGHEFGIPVVEDAIESFGSEYKGKKLGNTGADFTIFSFQPVRLPTTIDGGGIIAKKPEDHRKAILLRDYGIDRPNFRDNYGEIKTSCDISISGIGAGLNELGAYIGLNAMKELPLLLSQQRDNAIKNKDIIDEYNCEVIQHNETLPNYWIYSFLTQERHSMLVSLREKGLYASKVHVRNDVYSVFGKYNSDLKGVNQFNDQTLSIPCGWWIKSD